MQIHFKPNGWHAALLLAIPTFAFFGWTLIGAPLARNILLPTTQLSRFESHAWFVGPPRQPDPDIPKDTLEQLAQAGDAFGGFNAIVGLLTVLLVMASAVIQWVSLQESRLSITRQQFEDHFFKLLHLSREVAGEFMLSGSSENGEKTERKGFHAFVSVAWSVANNHHKYAWTTEAGNFIDSVENKDDAQTVCELVFSYLARGYEKYPSVFGPYMRLIYRLFWFIDTSRIPDDEKTSFAKLAAASIPDAAVLLIALNGLTKPGKKFHEMIERFGLLEHLHQQMAIKYSDALRTAYSERAFKFESYRVAESEKMPMAGFYFEEAWDRSSSTEP